jgi:hypothetical protein
MIGQPCTAVRVCASPRNQPTRSINACATADALRSALDCENKCDAASISPGRRWSILPRLRRHVWTAIEDLSPPMAAIQGFCNRRIMPRGRGEAAFQVADERFARTALSASCDWLRLRSSSVLSSRGYLDTTLTHPGGYILRGGSDHQP